MKPMQLRYKSYSYMFLSIQFLLKDLITQIKQRNIRTCVPSAAEHNPTSLTKHVVAVKSDVKTFHQLPLENIVLKKLFQVLHETMSEFSWDQ